MERKNSLRVALGLLLALSLPRLAAADPLPISGPPRPVALQLVASGLDRPTSIVNAGDPRLFLTLQPGRIVIVANGQVLPTPFLDIHDRLSCCDERGLLSVAFHPRYAQNGLFFVDYTDTNGDTVIARYQVSPGNPNVALPGSEQILLHIPQPFPNHNGGELQFGPDGYLYIGMGDGGSGGDPGCRAQGSDTLLGKLLRIDVDVATAPFYGVPPSNPFRGTAYPPEAWAIGLRNPWRFSFDRQTGDLYIADVGQNAREEIDFQPAGSAGRPELRLEGDGGERLLLEPGLPDDDAPLRLAALDPAGPRLRPRRGGVRGDRRLRLPRLAHPRARRGLRLRRPLHRPPVEHRAGGRHLAGALYPGHGDVAQYLRRGPERRALPGDRARRSISWCRAIRVVAAVAARRRRPWRSSTRPARASS